ncbi:phage portal protein [Ensifer sp. M14]|uniref:phage portal protein n=1 Tax=Ensifer sp. M14 TaxID=2203782 RepID=UPI001FCE7E2E|nr:phage portal protein [Ensifer sp. M14]
MKPRVRIPATSQPVKAVEGEPRDGPWLVSWPDGLLPDSWGKSWNFWQMGHDPIDGIGSVAVVEACVNAYAQTIAQCPATHWRALPDGGRERVNSAAYRVLKHPNDYMSRSDLIYQLVRDLFYHGNSYHLGRRNLRYEVDSLHPFDPRRSKAIVGEAESVWYELDGNSVLQGDNGGFFSGYANARQRLLVPARDCLHVKLQTEKGEYLKGLSPLRHATDAIIAQRMIGQRLIAMFASMGKPPGVIETSLNLTASQISELRAKINETWRGVDDINSGPPILTNGLQFKGISMTAQEAELANASKLTQDQIFMCLGVPPAILGQTDRSSYGSTEALIQSWLSSGLGFVIDHVETALDQFFDLDGFPEEYIELDTRALLRPMEKDRYDALSKAVISGIMSPNEARNSEDLPDVPYGDEPRVQQQVVPLSAWEVGRQEAPAAPTAGKSAHELDAISARARSEERATLKTALDEMKAEVATLTKEHSARLGELRGLRQQYARQQADGIRREVTASRQAEREEIETLRAEMEALKRALATVPKREEYSR